jgi:hypothetical protein
MTVILGRHHLLAATAESHYFSNCYAKAPDETDPQRLVGLFFANFRAGDLNIAPEELRVKLGDGPSSHAVVLGTVLSIIAQRQGKPIPVEKTPGHLKSVPLILDWFPEARVVCMVRDGRDVTLSLCRMSFVR